MYVPAVKRSTTPFLLCHKTPRPLATGTMSQLKFRRGVVVLYMPLVCSLGCIIPVLQDQSPLHSLTYTADVCCVHQQQSPLCCGWKTPHTEVVGTGQVLLLG